MPEARHHDRQGAAQLTPPAEATEAAGVTRTMESGGGALDESIGPYRLVQCIGEGGMGEVWLAEQMQPVRRRVAIKLIKSGMDTREVVARFESERQALALMDHPGIAKVFDAGCTARGRPYFVMEYVPGIPITAYCDRQRLTTRQRLELFIRVCESVQHAHQKAILHRDLKPSNILVTEVDGKPMPRVIDFGVAKAMTQGLTSDAMLTRVGGIVGTPGYMSPEQANSAGLDVDTRTDVYSLGVILYELLAGAPPLDFSKDSLEEMLRRLREQDAPKASTKVRGLGEQSSSNARNRGADPLTLARQLRGDLDAIALKCVEKDRSRRYATPAELAADIGRYLRNEPVVARPASLTYRGAKYIRRHRVIAAAAAICLVLLVAFTAMQAAQLRRITRERDRADRVTNFMTSMFKVSDPSEARGTTVTAREILDKASAEIQTALARDPELQARMMSTMGNTYEALGLHSRSSSLLEGAVKTQVRQLGPEHPDTLRSQSDWGWALTGAGHYVEAEKVLRKTLETQRRVLGPENGFTISSMSHLGTLLYIEARYPESERLLREAVENGRKLSGAGQFGVTHSMLALGMTLSAEGRYAEAEKLFRETLAMQRSTPEAEEAAITYTISNLADTLDSEGRYAEAEKLYREGIDVQRRILGPEHPSTLESLGRLSDTLATEGHNAEAETVAREALDISRRVRGPGHPGTLSAVQHYAAILSRGGRYSEAEKLFRESLAIAEKTKEPGTVAAAWYDFACGAAIAGRRDEALQCLRNALDHGLRNAGYMATDNDLKSLHGDAKFEALCAESRQSN